MEPAQHQPLAAYFISAPWRSSGKTILTAALARAAVKRGCAVRTFKKGPDFIDPMWLQLASGQPCINLDLFMQSQAELLQCYQRHSAVGSVALIEGTMGLHDGLAEDGSDSNAAVAKMLDSPVILIADCRGMHRTVAALIKGIQEFDPALQFAGLILNRVRSQRHQDKISAALAQYTDIRLLGAIPESSELKIAERELGLVPAAQAQDSDTLIETAATVLESSCDLDHILGSRPPPPATVSARSLQPDEHRTSAAGLSIAVAHDKAFNFYYQDDLQQLRERGARVIEVSPLCDAFPQQLDGMLIGGGFPERYGAELAANQGFREGLKAAIESGLCVRAECGGLMYLCRSISVDNTLYPMVGAIDGQVNLCQRPQGRGYVQLQVAGRTQLLNGHEFHHSSIDFDKPPQFEYRVVRGYGVDGKCDGVRVHNVLASYAHLRHTEATPWIDWFIGKIRQLQQSQDSSPHV